MVSYLLAGGDDANEIFQLDFGVLNTSYRSNKRRGPERHHVRVIEAIVITQQLTDLYDWFGMVPRDCVSIVSTLLLPIGKQLRGLTSIESGMSYARFASQVQLCTKSKTPVLEPSQRGICYSLLTSNTVLSPI